MENNYSYKLLLDTATQASPHRELVENMLHHHIERTFNWPAFEMNWPDPPAAERLGELAPKTLFLIGTEEIKDNLRVRDFYREHTNAQITLISEGDHMLTLTHAEDLRVKESRKRSLYFSSSLQGIMLMISTYPERFPIDEIKAVMVDEFCQPGAE